MASTRIMGEILSKLVESFQLKFTSAVNGQRIIRDMMVFLKYWLTNHILADDLAFGRFFVDQPQPEPVETGGQE